MQRTLVLVKPDGVQRTLVGEIIRRLEQRGLRLVGLKMMQVSAELAGRHSRPVVNAEHCVDRKLDEQAVVDHRLRARTAFLRRLEDEHDRAVELSMLRKVTRCSEQHGGMSVVAACVHFSVIF